MPPPPKPFLSCCLQAPAQQLQQSQQTAPEPLPQLPWLLLLLALQLLPAVLLLLAPLLLLLPPLAGTLACLPAGCSKSACSKSSSSSRVRCHVNSHHMYYAYELSCR
jgi:hypothetical protein